MFFGKRAQEERVEPILAETEIYACSSDTCNSWMRKDFASSDLRCPMCGQETVMQVRELPVIETY